jgi:uncharacterized protein YqeY
VNGSLAGQLRAALNAARKERDQERTLLLSTILSDVRNRELEQADPLGDTDVVEVLRRGIKRRNESVEAFRAGGRTEAADREAREVKALEAYLPAAPPDDEIRGAVREAIGAGAKDLGALMGKVMPLFKGRADGKTVNRIAREELAAAS